MSESNARKRNLPSWMGSREQENDEGDKSKQSRNHGQSNNDRHKLHLERKGGENFAHATSSGASGFSKLMDGVVFSLSGFVNPERGILRSQMLEMGAEYQPDWNSSCTLLVCAFSNTPKFRQVKAESGTVISKDWISESYSQRKLVDIEPFLLNAGKPWRRTSISDEATEDVKPSPSSVPLKQEERSSHSKKTSGSSKMKGCIISPSKAKKWAGEDLKRTILWLESQDERPESSEIKKIAAEGILTCLQDAIDALRQGQDVQKIAEQWACLPRVVEELAQFDSEKDGRPKEDLCREAMASKQIYELEFLNMEHEDVVFNNKRPKTQGTKKGNEKENIAGDDSCDSDATIEMTEEEIDGAYNNVVCSL